MTSARRSLRSDRKHEKRQNMLRSENKGTKRMNAEYGALKADIGISCDLADGVTLKDIEDTNGESSKSESAQKSDCIIKYMRS